MFLILFILAFLFALLLLIFVGPLPGKIAKKRNHPQAETIRACAWTAILAKSFSALLFTSFGLVRKVTIKIMAQSE